MTSVGALLDAMAVETADRLLAWTAAHARPAEQEWLKAMRGELTANGVSDREPCH